MKTYSFCRIVEVIFKGFFFATVFPLMEKLTMKIIAVISISKHILPF